ncbi:SRR1-like protein [Operophtera brumata]|uniref:SRR1-like protein n=1 Tax=Operophtera brumata TaxID=104452 RepID=A0A0L7KWY1_OPEBR|nr:SRR1-like protein [Operophtera brumata]
MSNVPEKDDGFRVVKNKRNSKNKQTKIPAQVTQYQQEDIFIDVDIVIRRIDTAVEDLRISDYFKGFSGAVSTVLQDRAVIEIICFGLGHFSECNISRYQLALLLCIKEFCSVTKVLVHDPIFYKSECEILRKLGLEVILENNEGSYVTVEVGITLAYFPHCPKQLTNNFLWCNWSAKLYNCLLVCNSFTALIVNHPNRILSESVPYIYKIHPHTDEIILENNFKFTDIFNDTSLHNFPKHLTTDSEFWIKGDKPTYENTEEFITSLMIEKLNI